MRGVLRAIVVAASGWRCKGGRAGLGRWTGGRNRLMAAGVPSKPNTSGRTGCPGWGRLMPARGELVSGVAAKGRGRRSPRSRARTTSIPYGMNRTWTSKGIGNRAGLGHAFLCRRAAPGRQSKGAQFCPDSNPAGPVNPVARCSVLWKSPSSEDRRRQPGGKAVACWLPIGSTTSGRGIGLDRLDPCERLEGWDGATKRVGNGTKQLNVLEGDPAVRTNTTRAGGEDLSLEFRHGG